MALAEEPRAVDRLSTMARVLVAISDALQTGYMPAGKEIAAAIGHNSRGAVVRAVDQLDDRGFIRRDQYKRWRSIQVTPLGDRLVAQIKHGPTPERAAPGSEDGGK